MRKVSFDLIDHIHESWINTETREVWLHGMETGYFDREGDTEPGVEYVMATRLIKNLHLLQHMSKVEPVTIHMHTCGGFVEDGMAIYDTIKAMPYHITIISYTHARSMSSVILQAADDRVMLPHSYFMFHEGTVEFSGENRTVYSQVAHCKKIDDQIVDIYTDKAFGSEMFPRRRWPKRKIKEHLIQCMKNYGDYYLAPEEAIKWGFADRVIHTFKEL